MAKKLIRTGYKPQATWGQAARGLAPTSIKKYRANVATAQPQWRPGACTTMMLELAQHPVEDPAIELRAAFFGQRFGAVRDMPKLSMQLKRLWLKRVAKLQVPSRWSRVCDQTGVVVVATLLDLHWDPIRLDCWISPTGESCELDYDAPPPPWPTPSTWRWPFINIGSSGRMLQTISMEKVSNPVQICTP